SWPTRTSPRARSDPAGSRASGTDRIGLESRIDTDGSGSSFGHPGRSGSPTGRPGRVRLTDLRLDRLAQHDLPVVLERPAQRAAAVGDVLLEEAGEAGDHVGVLVLDILTFGGIRREVIELDRRQAGGLLRPRARGAPAARVGAERELP